LTGKSGKLNGGVIVAVLSGGSECALNRYARASEHAKTGKEKNNGEALAVDHPDIRLAWILSRSFFLEKLRTEFVTGFAELIILLPQANNRSTRHATLDSEGGDFLGMRPET